MARADGNSYIIASGCFGANSALALAALVSNALHAVVILLPESFGERTQLSGARFERFLGPNSSPYRCRVTQRGRFCPVRFPTRRSSRVGRASLRPPRFPSHRRHLDGAARPMFLASPHRRLRPRQPSLQRVARSAHPRQLCSRPSSHRPVDERSIRLSA